MAGSSKKGAAWGWRRLALGAGCVAGLAAAGYVGSLFLPRATAQPSDPSKPAAAQPAAPGQPASDYSQRPVAFLHGNEAITREQLGEYLIARYGADKLPLLVNKLIIDEACRAKGIEVTAAEVEASLAEDLSTMGPITPTEFENRVLKQYKKTLYEWKEDVVRPKLLMTKLVRDRVKVTDDDIKAGYEAYYGEKVDCNVIYWPKEEERIAEKQYASIRDHDDEFDRKARMQANSNLAATGGHIPPIGHHTTGSDEMERTAFQLQPGEISKLIDTPDGVVVIKCLKHIPPDTSVSLESFRPKLYKEIFDKKVQMEIPKAFAELQKEANVSLLLNDPKKQDNLTETTQQLLNDGVGTPGAPTKGVVPAAGAH